MKNYLERIGAVRNTHTMTMVRRALPNQQYILLPNNLLTHLALQENNICQSYTIQYTADSQKYLHIFLITALVL